MSYARYKDEAGRIMDELQDSPETLPNLSKLLNIKMRSLARVAEQLETAGLIERVGTVNPAHQQKGGRPQRPACQSYAGPMQASQNQSRTLRQDVRRSVGILPLT